MAVPPLERDSVGSKGSEKPRESGRAFQIGKYRPRLAADHRQTFGTEWFAYLIENTLDIITVLDAELTILYASPSAERVLGYIPQELLGTNALELIHPDDAAMALSVMRQALVNPQAGEPADVRLRHRDGSWRVQEAVGKRLPPGAPVSGLVVNLRDSTLRYKAAEAERKRQERLSRQQAVLVALASRDVLHRGDLQTAVREITTVAASTLDVERASVWLFDDNRCGITSIDLYEKSSERHSSGIELAASDYPHYFEAMESDRAIAASDAHQDTRTREFSDSYLTPLGITSMLHAPIRLQGQTVGVVCCEHIGPIRQWTTEDQNFAGSIADMVSLAMEADRRKTTEDALRQSEAQHRALVEHAMYGIYRSSSDGRFLSVNPALVEMLGYESEQEVLGLDIAKDIYAGPMDRASLVEQYRDRKRIHGVEVEWKRKDGSFMSVRLSGRPVCDDRGVLDCFEMIAEDMSEHRTLEQQLRQAQKMEAVGQLTGGIAHDFNNMLSIVIANAEMVANSLTPEQSVLRVDVQEIRQAAQKTAKMVKQLMGFSRQAELVMKPTNLCTVVDNLSSMLAKVLPENINLQIVCESVARVSADSGAIEQILLNLATNARDAMPDGGVLRIAVHNTELDEIQSAKQPWLRPGKYVRMTVSDTGMGMDPLARAKVFEPFFTTKPAGVGTGLGMAMVYGLTKQHDGFVHVYSEVGRGSVIKVYLPAIACDSRDDTASQSSEELVGGNETILLVEDEEALRRTGKRVLERFGYWVIPASDGQEGLELYRANCSGIDLVISDMVMPRLGGWELFQLLQDEPEPVRFLMASGYGEADETGATPDSRVPFVQKPWTVRELLYQVRAVLDEALGGGHAPE